MLKKKKFFLLWLIFLLLGSFAFLTSPTKAQTQLEVGHFGGSAWSPNIGWIDMSGVSFIPTLDLGQAVLEIKDLSGYAWSPNVGWISFQETTGCPSGNCRARISLESNAFLGWARVLSMNTNLTENQDREFNLSADISQDWANGWIKLDNVGVPNSGTGCYILTGGTSGTGGGPTGGVAGTCFGYAWGSRVLGWINFSRVTAGFYPGSDANVFLYVDNSSGIPVIGPVSLPSGTSSIHLTWEGTNLSSATPNCNLVYNYNGGQNIHLPPLTSGQIFNLSAPSANGFLHTASWGNIPNGVYTYRMACAGTPIPNLSMNIGHSNLVTVFIGVIQPEVDLQASYCNTLIANVSGANICTGNATDYLGTEVQHPWSSNNVPSGYFCLKCGGVEDCETVYDPGVNCSNPPENGNNKIPLFKEN